MERLIEIRTIGRDGNCHLQIDGEGIEDNHARIGLSADGGMVLIHDAENGTSELNRGAGWLAVRRARLSAGDRFRFGGTEVAVDALAELFEGEVESAESANEGPRPLRLVTKRKTNSIRNPGTGQIEALPERTN